MASVRLSQDMRSRILNRARDAFNIANPEWKPSNDFQLGLKKALSNSESQKIAKQVHDLVTNKASGFGLAKMAPEPYKFTGLSIKRLANPQEQLNNRTSWNSDYMELRVEFDSPVTLWNKPSGYESYASTIGIDDLNQEDRTEILEYVNAAHESIHDRESAKDTYDAQIASLLNNCNTLKQLLEAWPAAENLVDQDAISKMHEKVTRVTAARERRESVNFDADAANQMVLTAKLVGA